MEIELKLLIAREDAQRVFGAEAVKRRMRAKARTQELASVYFDTPGQRLWKAGLALRLRQSASRGRPRWIQTLKSDSGAGAKGAAGLHQREEYEWPVAGPRVDLAPLDASPYAAAFARRGVRDGLRAAFATRFRRSACRIELAEGAAAELCVDSGWIRAGKHREAICEIEIELAADSADPRPLFRFAKELLQEIPFRLGAASKAERGYALAQGTAPRPHKAGTIAISPDMNRAAALLAVARACLVQVHANEDGFLHTKDSEYLHQLRVGFRRLRVALATPQDAEWLAAREPLREEFRWLFSQLGPARNWDVFVGELLPPLLQRAEPGDDLSALGERCLRERRRHLARAREAVRGPRYAALLLSIGELLAGPLPAEAVDEPASAREFARASIERRERALRKRGEALVQASPEERHRTRIAAKKLRYASDFFAGLYPHKRVRRYLDALAELQEVLGEINDAAVSAAMIGRMAPSPRADRLRHERVIGLVQGWLASREAHAVGRLTRAWEKFAAHKPFWD
jgi:inorganic triphosphatase YgiF